eukprot:1143163_1
MYTHSHLRFSLPTCLVYSFYAFHPMLYYLTAMTPSSSHLSYPSCFDFTICVSIHSITMHDPHNFRASINRLKGNVEFHIFCSYSGRMSCRDCFSPSCSWRHNCRLNLAAINWLSTGHIIFISLHMARYWSPSFGYETQRLCPHHS